MKKFLLTIAASVLFASAASAWNGTIHAGITAIAEANLTPTAKAEIERVFEGKTLYHYAYWLHDVLDEPAHAEAKNWSRVACSAEGKVLKTARRAKSDDYEIRTAGGYDAIVQAVKALSKRGSLSDAEVADNIRYIVYTVAELHNPTSYLFIDHSDAERNPMYTRGKKEYSYNALWESTVILATHNMRGREFVHLLDRKSDAQIAAIVAGSVERWIEGNARGARRIIAETSRPGKLDDKTYRLWLNKMYPYADEQAAVAGYRIAHLLNRAFDASYAKSHRK